MRELGFAPWHKMKEGFCCFCQDWALDRALSNRVGLGRWCVLGVLLCVEHMLIIEHPCLGQVEIYCGPSVSRTGLQQTL